MAQLDYGNPEVRREMIATMRWWLEEFGIDGFRMDVAGFIPLDFWREAVPALRAAVPRRILLLAEWDDPELHRLGFDLTYGWDSLQAAQGGVARGAGVRFVAAGGGGHPNAMPAGGGPHAVHHQPRRDRLGRPAAQPSSAGAPGARAAYVAVALLPGRPLLYNGQEVESPQKLALFERGPIAWDQPASRQRRGPSIAAWWSWRGPKRRFIGEGAPPVTTSAPNDVIAYRRGDVIVLVNAASPSGARRP